MQKSVFRCKKFYLVTIILIAAAGSIFFFPMNMSDQYTCFYHRLFDPPQYTASLKTATDTHGDVSNQDIHNELSQHHSVLLDNYLDQYAFIWWSSVGLWSICVYLFFKLRRNIKNHCCSLTEK